MTVPLRPYDTACRNPWVAEVGAAESGAVDATQSPALLLVLLESLALDSASITMVCYAGTSCTAELRWSWLDPSGQDGAAEYRSQQATAASTRHASRQARRRPGNLPGHRADQPQRQCARVTATPLQPRPHWPRERQAAALPKLGLPACCSRPCRCHCHCRSHSAAWPSRSELTDRRYLTATCRGRPSESPPSPPGAGYGVPSHQQ
jgi:hypothetical protein